MGYLLKIIFVAFTALLATACTVNKQVEEFQKIEKVEARVAGRWEALLKKDYTEAYTFLSQGYTEVVSKDEYLRTRNSRIIWTGYDITRTRCKEDVCKVNLEVTYSIPPMFGMPKGSKATDNIKETWLLNDQEWYYIPPMNK